MTTLETVTNTLLTCSSCVLILQRCAGEIKREIYCRVFWGDRWHWLEDCPTWDPQVKMTQAIRAVQAQYHHLQIRETERSTAGQFSLMKCFVVSQIFLGKRHCSYCVSWCRASHDICACKEVTDSFQQNPIKTHLSFQISWRESRWNVLHE